MHNIRYHRCEQLRNIHEYCLHNKTKLSRSDLTLQRAEILIYKNGLEYLRLKHGLISKLPFRASVCYQIEIFPKVSVQV